MGPGHVPRYRRVRHAVQGTRIEVSVKAPVAEDGFWGWKMYISEEFGYALRYPGECTVMGASHDEFFQL